MKVFLLYHEGLLVYMFNNADDAVVSVVKLDGVNDVELFASDSVKRVVSGVGGYADVAYTVDGVTFVQLVGDGDLLFLPAGVSAVVRGDGSVKIVESPGFNFDTVKFVVF